MIVKKLVLLEVFVSVMRMFLKEESGVNLAQVWIITRIAEVFGKNCNVPGRSYRRFVDCSVYLTFRNYIEEHSFFM